MPDEPPVELSYYVPTRYRRAQTLLNFVIFFNAVQCFLDFLAAVALLLISILGLANSPADFALPRGLLPFVFVVLSASVAALRYTTVQKLIHRRPHARMFGIACGAVGCMQWWFGIACVIPFAFAIFTLIVLNLPETRAYLTENESTPGPSFPPP